MSDVLIRREGRAGRITLNRPKALNALTYEMLTGIERALDSWADDAAVELVVIDAAGDKAFAAGGDIVDLYRTGREGDFSFGRRFWADEYRLNAMIANYPKPYVALIDGVTEALSPAGKSFGAESLARPLLDMKGASSQEIGR